MYGYFAMDWINLVSTHFLNTHHLCPRKIQALIQNPGDTIDLLAWSEAELTVATICVCLPSLKSILNKHLPRYFSNASSTHYLGGIEPRAMLSVESPAGTGTTSLRFEQGKNSMRVGINEHGEVAGDKSRVRQVEMDDLQDGEMESLTVVKDEEIIVGVCRPEKVRVGNGRNFSRQMAHASDGLELSSFEPRKIQIEIPLDSRPTGGIKPAFQSQTQAAGRPEKTAHLRTPRYGNINSTRLLNQPQQTTQVIIGKRDTPLLFKEIVNGTHKAISEQVSHTQKSREEKKSRYSQIDETIARPDQSRVKDWETVVKRTDRYEVINERGVLMSPTFLIMDD